MRHTVRAPPWWSPARALALTGTLLGPLLGVPLAAQRSIEAPPTAGAGARPAPEVAVLLDVPFVAQEELLCGGAAVEMALRHRGVRGVFAHDFRRLVRPDEGGIRTDDLTDAVRALGWSARAAPAAGNGADPLVAALADGRPPIVLLAVGEGRHHYVLVVGHGDGAFVVHDPAERPNVSIPEEAFLERWSASGRWALVLGEREGHVRGAAPPTAEHGRTARAGTPLAEASARFRAGRWAEAAALAERATAAQPTDASAWRLLATARYLDGDADGALRAWNEVGEPLTETVTVVGLERTRHPVVHALLGLRAGEPLTPAAVARARRRLELLPAAEATSLAYRMAPGGRAAVTGAVAERPVLPRAGRAVARAALSALAESEAVVEVGPVTGGGETLEVTARWARAHPFLGASLSAPSLLGAPGVGILSVSREGERHRAPGEADVSLEERVRVRMGLADWASSRVFWRAGGGLDRWSGGRRSWVVDAGSAVELGNLRVDAGAELAAGGEGAPRYLRWDLEARWAPASPGPWSVRLRGLAAGVGEAAPLSARPGADAGRARRGLLRAHPLERDGALEARQLGTAMLNGSAEIARHLLVVPALGTVEVALFVDALHLAGPGSDRGAGGGALVDGGAGLRAHLPGGTLRLDGALGRAGARALSLVWTPSGTRLR